MAKKIEHICGNCRLFNAPTCRCSVVILHEGQKFNIPVDAEDPCFFEEPYFDPVTKTLEDFNEIKEIKMWVEDDQGRKCTQGTVKIEYPSELDMNR